MPLLLAFTYKSRLKQIHGLAIFAFLFFILNKLTLKLGIVDAIRRGQSFLNPDTIIGEILSGHITWQSVVDTFGNNLFGYFAANFLITDGVILILGLLGIWKLVQDRRLTTRLLIIFIVGYFIFASFFFYPLLRYLLPIVILFIPLAAYGISKIRPIPWIVLAVILFVASINSLWWNYLYLKTPTFIQARDWIIENIPPEVPIAYIGGRYQTFSPNRDSIIHMQTVNNNYSKSLLLRIGSDNLDNVRNIIYVSNFSGENKLEQLKNATKEYPVKYVIDFYSNPEESIYRQNQEVFEIIAYFTPKYGDKVLYPPEPLFDPRLNFPFPKSKIEFSMYSLERIGPYIDILKIKNF